MDYVDRIVVELKRIPPSNDVRRKEEGITYISIYTFKRCEEREKGGERGGKKVGEVGLGR